MVSMSHAHRPWSTVFRAATAAVLLTCAAHVHAEHAAPDTSRSCSLRALWHELTTPPAARHASCILPLRSLVREGVRGVPATVSRVSMAPAVVTPDESPARHSLSLPTVSRAALTTALLVVAGLLVLALLVVVVLRILFGLDDLTRSQQSVARTQSAMLDALATLVSATPSSPARSATRVDQQHGLALGIAHAAPRRDPRGPGAAERS
jgi:hypothetical protein